MQRKDPSFHFLRSSQEDEGYLKLFPNKKFTKKQRTVLLLNMGSQKEATKQGLCNPFPTT